jgi:hypothetical protein
MIIKNKHGCERLITSIALNWLREIKKNQMSEVVEDYARTDQIEERWQRSIPHYR